MSAEEFDPDTGEVSETKTADGGRRYPAATTMTDLIHMLNDGSFNQNCADKLRDFSADMEELGVDTGKKVKGKITLTIEVEREHDGPPPAAEIMRLENTEQRRIACEMRGWHNILPELPGAKMIDRHDNPQIGELWEADLPDDVAARLDDALTAKRKALQAV